MRPVPPQLAANVALCGQLGSCPPQPAMETPAMKFSFAQSVALLSVTTMLAVAPAWAQAGSAVRVRHEGWITVRHQPEGRPAQRPGPHRLSAPVRPCRAWPSAASPNCTAGCRSPRSRPAVGPVRAGDARQRGGDGSELPPARRPARLDVGGRQHAVIRGDSNSSARRISRNWCPHSRRSMARCPISRSERPIRCSAPMRRMPGRVPRRLPRDSRGSGI